MGEGPAEEGANRLAPWLAIAAFALLLVLPAVFRPPMQHDSFWINWVWADQFTELLRQGQLYPRWLPRSHDGLGSPVFYYYPPLSFHLIGLLGLSGLSVWGSILAAFGIAFFLSGAAMYAWLRDWTEAPLAGALFFMAAPYHFIDFVSRGNIGESLGYAFIPLAALGIRRIGEGRGPALAAFAYAGLILAHLPLALLASLFLVGPYALMVARRSPARIFTLGAALGCGLALSGLYLLPALLLEPWRDAAQLWARPDFHAENWSLLRWDVAGPSPGMRRLMAATLAVLAVATLVLFLARRSLWAGWAALGLLLAAGLVPGFWTLPLIERVQFPFRLLPIAEFALATAFALAAPTGRLARIALLPPLALSLALLVVRPPALPQGPELTLARHPDVPENLPPADRPYGWPSRWALDLAERHRVPVTQGGVTVEPVFHFPSWRVDCADGPATPFPDPATGLLAHRGAAPCTRRLVTLEAERIGALASLAGLAGLIAMLALPRLRRRRRGAG